MGKQHTNILVSVTLLFAVYLAGFYTGRNWNHGPVQVSHVISEQDSLVASEPAPISLAKETEAVNPETRAIPETQGVRETEILPETTEQPQVSATVPAPTEAPTSATEATHATQPATEPNQTQATESHSGLININTASAATLETLPGIGETLAQRIVEYRQTYGPFQSVYALTNVKGIGEKRLAAIINLITV